MFTFACCVIMEKLGLEVWAISQPCMSTDSWLSRTQDGGPRGPTPRNANSALSLWNSGMNLWTLFLLGSWNRPPEKDVFWKSLKNCHTYCLSFQWSGDSSACIWKFWMQAFMRNKKQQQKKKPPNHGSVHFRRRINMDYDPLDRTDAPTTEGIFAHSFIKHQEWFSGSNPAESTYFRILIFLFP